MSPPYRIGVIRTTEQDMEGEENDRFLYKCLEAVGLQQHYVR